LEKCERFSVSFSRSDILLIPVVKVDDDVKNSPFFQRIADKWISGTTNRWSISVQKIPIESWQMSCTWMSGVKSSPPLCRRWAANRKICWPEWSTNAGTSRGSRMVTWLHICYVFHNWDKLTDNSQVLFVDRDPSMFGYVLNFLRDGKNIVLPSEEEKLLMLKNEADFYQISRLQNVVNCKLRELSQKK